MPRPQLKFNITKPLAAIFSKCSPADSKMQTKLGSTGLDGKCKLNSKLDKQEGKLKIIFKLFSGVNYLAA